MQHVRALSEKMAILYRTSRDHQRPEPPTKTRWATWHQGLHLHGTDEMHSSAQFTNHSQYSIPLQVPQNKKFPPQHSELQGFCPLSIVRNSKHQKTCVGNWICFLPQVSRETPTQLGPLERANPHWAAHVEDEVHLWPTVSRPTYLGVGFPSGAHDQIYVFWQVSWCRAPSLTRGWVWNLLLQLLLGLARAVTLGLPYFALSFETPPTWRARSPYLHPQAI
jgi:hypothetical protein